MEILKNKTVQLVLAIAAGIGIGVVFYPSKTIEKRVKQEIISEYDKRIETLSEEKSKIETKYKQKLTEQEREFKSKEVETRTTLEQLRTENYQLKQSSKKNKYKIVKPDGTIIEKEYEESNSEETNQIVTEIRREFDQKVKSIEDKWKSIHEERLMAVKSEFDSKVHSLEEEHKKEISRIEEKRREQTSIKKFRPEVGITSDLEAYIHITHDVWGPVFIGGGVTSTRDTLDHVSVGVGISF